MNHQSGFGGFQDDSRDFYDKAKRFKSGKTKKWIILALAVIVLGVVVSPLYHLIMEYWQIKEIGEAYTSVFLTNLSARLLTQTVGFVLIFTVLLVNVLLVKRLAVDSNFSAAFLKKKWSYMLLCLILSLSVSDLAGGSLYQKLLLAANAESFGISDPIFSQDIGYYIFSRPFLISLVGGGKTLLLLMILMAAVVYALIFVKNGHRSLKEVISGERGALLHVLVLAVLYFLLSVMTYKFSAENILYSSFGTQNEIFGAGYVEANIWQRYYQFAPYIVLASVVLIAVFLYRKKYLSALLSAGILPLAFLLFGAVSVGVDSLIVNPNERNLQSEYIAYNMEATNQAYHLEKVAEKEFVPEYDMTAAAMEEDDTWLAGTRIADFGSTQTAYNQLQFLRKYYTFHDVDVVPYELEGKLNVVFLAAREMNKENLDGSANSYANQIFRYTHGFGVVASPVNRVTAEGQPEFLIKDIPPQSSGGMPEITQPRIYYGEMTEDYVIVGGENRELDYSEGLEDIEFTFDGDAGIKLSPFKRLMFAWYYKDYRMLLSGNVSGDSKILINRNVLDRVKRIAPFISYDNDPYIVVSDEGELYWIINGYTTSADYPYAQPYGDVNYIRNSITAVVNAYTGDVKFYITDETDPIARAYCKIYPDLFTEGDLPEGVASHIRVPEFMFRVQAELYQRYHVKDAGQFYDRADVWDIAGEKYQDNEIEVEPYYNIMEIDGREEMVLTLPFVVQGKHNMVGLLVQRGAPEHYGELLLYRFPKNETVYGPMQIENRIDNDPDISREMTLWGQGGSSVIRGNLLVVPYRNSLLYVEPVYITSKNNASLPELKRIVVSYGDAVAMEPTLEAALRSALEKSQGMSAPQTDKTEAAMPEGEIRELTETIRSLLESYDSFKESAGHNDWQSMGDSLSELDRAMEYLKEYQEAGN